jgi:hypothetical protein
MVVFARYQLIVELLLVGSPEYVVFFTRCYPIPHKSNPGLANSRDHLGTLPKSAVLQSNKVRVLTI